MFVRVYNFLRLKRYRDGKVERKVRKESFYIVDRLLGLDR